MTRQVFLNKDLINKTFPDCAIRQLMNACKGGNYNNKMPRADKYSTIYINFKGLMYIVILYSFWGGAVNLGAARAAKTLATPLAL